MERILFKRTVFIFCILFVFIIVLFSTAILYSEKQATFDQLDEMLKQGKISYDKSHSDTEAATELFEDDYLNRAYAIDFMLHNNSDANFNTDTLNKIKQLMNVQSINIIDHTGQIVLSSEKESIGLNLKAHEECEPFIQLIDSSDANAHVIQLDGMSITDKETKTYIGVKSSSETYSVVQIELDRNVFERFIENHSISSIIENIPTVYEEAVFVMDKKSGQLDAITVNNEQEINLNYADSKEKQLFILNNSTEGTLIEINGSMKFLKTKIVNDKIIGAYMSADAVYKRIFRDILLCAMATVIILTCIFYIFRYHVRRFVLQDIQSISLTIKELMSGNKDVTFKTEYNTEFQYITTILNEWKDSYKYKSERMARIFATLGSNVAVFECLYKINHKFFTDNTPSILGVDHDTWHEIINSPKGFEEYLKSLMSDSDDEIIALPNNKFIQIVSFTKENEFYGMIMDKTEDVHVKNKMQQELLAAQVSAETDSLTQLKNRSGIERLVAQSLNEKPGQGTMIICDLDNFKLVNDQKGHLEGDKVLQKFARCLESFTRPSDIVGRMGGDEFLIFIPSNIPIQTMETKLQSMLKVIRMELGDYYNHFNLSTSIGVAYVDPSKNSYKDLYLCADVGLYIAKGLGKDGFYINEENIHCTRENCIQCTDNCKKRELLGL